MRRSFVRFLLLLALLGSAPRGVDGQGLWTEASTVGYGASALGLSVWARWSCDYEAVVLILAAGVAGSWVGHRIGGSAEGAARRGEPLTVAQLWGARVGTVTGFGALGAGIAALIINETEGNQEGEDERRLLTYTIAGAAVGVLVEVLQESGLPDEASAALTSIVLQPAGGGALRVGIRRSVS